MARWSLLVCWSTLQATAVAESCASLQCVAIYRSDASCQCFPGCEVYNNCCSDFKEVCMNSKGEFMPAHAYKEVTTTTTEYIEHKPLISTPVDHASRSQALRKVAGNCRSFGCGVFAAAHNCQCNDGCVAHGSCCDDFQAICPDLFAKSGAGSCRGSCGIWDARRQCQCDAECYLHGNCCHDFAAHCKQEGRAASCKALGCGTFGAQNFCQCNAACAAFGSCCEDYAEYCNTGSCATYGCGPFHAGHSCQCNPGCERFGNCCGDFQHVCEGASGFSEGSRLSCAEVGCNFVSGRACQCNSGCQMHGNCCIDFESTCSLPKEPLGSCAVFGCIEFREGNDCQCSPECQAHGNCCPDAFRCREL
ncbi:unnamed protein product [Effrenium voratum]|uniref:SMB domain-containing protein n=1 Tax=Effrenium voratum TaxID=2562239 RepID=A0AA36MY15_9DINO|nr:unnamed protein product [Effrenium voratum]